MTVESFPTISRRANFALGEMEGTVTLNEELQITSGTLVKATVGDHSLWLHKMQLWLKLGSWAGALGAPDRVFQACTPGWPSTCLGSQIFCRAVTLVSVGGCVQWETEQKKVTANHGDPQKQSTMKQKVLDEFTLWHNNVHIFWSNMIQQYKLFQTMSRSDVCKIF